MGAQPELPFFRNPAYRPIPAAEAAAAVVDPALDEEHIRERAAGRGPRPGRRTRRRGRFAGRRPQLRSLVDWMDGHNDPVGPAAKGDGLVVVTGSPGVGTRAAGGAGVRRASAAA